MIPDPEDPRFAYRPGTLLVERRPNRLRLAGDEAQVSPVFQRGPVTTARLADDHPEYTTAELASLAVRSQQLISALTEENDRLRSETTRSNNTNNITNAPASIGSEDTAPYPAGDKVGSAESVSAQAPAPRANSAQFEEFNIVRPNSENIIELDPALFMQPVTADHNPFVQIYQPTSAPREITLVVSAVVPGPSPTAVINDIPYGLNNQFQGLDIHRIDTDTVYLRKDSFLLACPVSEKPLRLRIP